jgi:hypothetical protein
VAWFGVDDLPTAELAHPALDGLLRGVLEQPRGRRSHLLTGDVGPPGVRTPQGGGDS